MSNITDRRKGEPVDFTELKMPYDLCWIDYSAGHKENYSDFSDGGVSVPKRGMLVYQNLKHDDDIMYMTIFNFFRNESHWFPNLFTYKIFKDDSLFGHIPKPYSEGMDYIDRIKKKLDPKKHCKTELIPLFKNETLYREVTMDKINEIFVSDSSDMGVLYGFLLFLSCKNITTKIIPAPDKLNKKRIKHGKQPLFSYHTLVIKPVGKRQESIPRHLWENRIHLQRGHFKTYTAEKPLFGHVTGRFWWQPHIRGQNKDGVVMKDYDVSQFLTKH